MKTSEYLYGLKSLKGALEGVEYIEALESKIQLSEILIRKLLSVHYMERDSQRVNDCLRAQSHNRELIREVVGKSEHKEID